MNEQGKVPEVGEYASGVIKRKYYQVMLNQGTQRY